MDPLSITASAITIIAALNQSLKIIKAVRNIPKEVKDILDESSQAEIVLRQVEAFLKSPSLKPTDFIGADGSHILTSILERLRRCLQEIHGITQSHLDLHDSSAHGKSMPCRSATSRWFTSRKLLSKLNEHKITLQNSRISMSLALSLITTYHSQEIDQHALGLLQQLRESYKSQTLFQQSAIGMLGTQACILQDIHKQLYLLNDHPPHGSIHELEEVPGLLPEEQPESNSKRLHKVEKAVDPTILQTLPVWLGDNDHEMDNTQLRAGPRRGRRRRSSTCSVLCPCTCHIMNMTTLGKSVAHFIGSGSISFITPQMIRGPCSETRCRRRSSPVAHLEYTFPRWLLLAWISATVTMRSLTDVEIQCRAMRLCSDLAPVFKYAIEGDLMGIHRLFDQGEASPYDVDVNTRTSLLVYATDRGHVDLWRFLIDAGADPYLENGMQHAPIDIACARILGKSTNPQIISAMEEDFDIEEYLEYRHLPPLQSIVLGYNKIDLVSYLSVSTAEIDEEDYQGRTALSWAALVGDVDSVTTLLSYGADPNIAGHALDAPLHYAVRARNADCIEPLIQHGANVNALNAWHVSPLGYTNAFRDDPRYAEPLVAAGADVNLLDKHGRSALVRAVYNNRPNLCRYLLEHGAEWVESDSWGYETLKASIQKGYRDVTAVLLEARSTFMTESEVKTVLEFAEVEGDQQTICALRKIQTHFFDGLPADQSSVTLNIQQVTLKDDEVGVIPLMSSVEISNTPSKHATHAPQCQTTGYRSAHQHSPTLRRR